MSPPVRIGPIKIVSILSGPFVFSFLIKDGLNTVLQNSNFLSDKKKRSRQRRCHKIDKKETKRKTKRRQKEDKLYLQDGCLCEISLVARVLSTANETNGIRRN